MWRARPRLAKRDGRDKPGHDNKKAALGWRAMRWITALGICLAAGFLSGGLAHAANDGSFRIGDWTGRPYFSEQKDKKQKEKF